MEREREREGKGENTRDEGRNAEKEIIYVMNVGNQRGSRERLNATMEMQPYRLQIRNSISGHQTTTCYYYAIKVYHYPFSD